MCCRERRHERSIHSEPFSIDVGSSLMKKHVQTCLNKYSHIKVFRSRSCHCQNFYWRHDEFKCKKKSAVLCDSLLLLPPRQAAASFQSAMLKIVGNLDHNWWSNLDKKSPADVATHVTTISQQQKLQLTIQHTTTPVGASSQRYAMLAFFRCTAPIAVSPLSLYL